MFLAMVGGRRLVAGAAVALAMASLAGGASPAQACSSEPVLGAVCMTAGQYCPRGYVETKGQILPISGNEALFSLVGCTFGGDCRSNFGVPNMQTRSPVGTGQGPGLSDVRFGANLGGETQTLTVAQMPTHTHTAVLRLTEAITFNAYDGKGDSPTPSATNAHLQTVSENGLSANSKAKIYGSGNGNSVLLGGVGLDLEGQLTVTPTGRGGPFDVRAPSTAVRFCMASSGMYPPRD